MKWHVVNIEGKKLREIELPESVFGCESNESVIHSVVKSYMANRRQGTHATKTRSLVSGGGKKPFRQKGTGSARQGSSRSPLMEGGAVSHGPQPRDYTQRINKKVKQKAMLIALSDKVRHNNLVWSIPSLKKSFPQKSRTNSPECWSYAWRWSAVRRCQSE